MALVTQCSKVLARYSLYQRIFNKNVTLSAVEQEHSSKGQEQMHMGYGLWAALGAIAFGTGATLIDGQVSADELELHHPHYQWDHQKMFTSYDHAGLRRGFQVYKEVCQACHSLQYLCFRHHIDVTHTKDELKAIAAEYMYKELNDDGEAVDRPGNVQDYLPEPYENEIKARLANNGALPPDMTQIVLAREGNEDYIYALLTGYEDIPAGQKDAEEGQAYNPYFHGYYLGMAQQIYDESVDYEDGTVPYKSQIAKDITQYLAWASDPYKDESKLYGMKPLLLFNSRPNQQKMISTLSLKELLREVPECGAEKHTRYPEGIPRDVKFKIGKSHEVTCKGLNMAHWSVYFRINMMLGSCIKIEGFAPEDSDILVECFEVLDGTRDLFLTVKKAKIAYRFGKRFYIPKLLQGIWEWVDASIKPDTYWENVVSFSEFRSDFRSNFMNRLLEYIDNDFTRPIISEGLVKTADRYNNDHLSCMMVSVLFDAIIFPFKKVPKLFLDKILNVIYVYVNWAIKQPGSLLLGHVIERFHYVSVITLKRQEFSLTFLHSCVASSMHALMKRNDSLDTPEVDVNNYINLALDIFRINVFGSMMYPERNGFITVTRSHANFNYIFYPTAALWAAETRAISEMIMICVVGSNWVQFPFVMTELALAWLFKLAKKGDNRLKHVKELLTRQLHDLPCLPYLYFKAVELKLQSFLGPSQTLCVSDFTGNVVATATSEYHICRWDWEIREDIMTNKRLYTLLRDITQTRTPCNRYPPSTPRVNIHKCQVFNAEEATGLICREDLSRAHWWAVIHRMKLEDLKAATGEEDVGHHPCNSIVVAFAMEHFLNRSICRFFRRGYSFWLYCAIPRQDCPRRVALSPEKPSYFHLTKPDGDS